MAFIACRVFCVCFGVWFWGVIQVSVFPLFVHWGIKFFSQCVWVCLFVSWGIRVCWVGCGGGFWGVWGCVGVLVCGLLLCFQFFGRRLCIGWLCMCQIFC